MIRRIPWPAMFIICLFMRTPAASADDPVPVPGGTVQLRALRSHVSGDMVRFIAINTAPSQLDPANFDTDRTLTPSEIITRLCGSVREEYYEEFLKLNDTRIARDTPIGDDVRKLQWPSCLYIRPADTGEWTVVNEGDSADKIYQRMTGGLATKRQLAAYFDAPLYQLRWLHPGDTLAVGHVTAPVQVEPTINYGAFMAKFTVLAKTQQGTDARIVTSDLSGQIILPMEGDGIASSAGDCTPSGPPFDAAGINLALSYSRKRRDNLDIFPGQAEVIVVDNGFRGIDLSAEIDESNPFAGSFFEKRFFQVDDESIIARKITIGRPYWPLIASSDSSHATQGHGTHVAGLVLGGPTFRAFWSDSSSIANTWAKLTVLNVSDGERSIDYGAVSALHRYLGVPSSGRIVNMSISFDGNVSPDVKTAFDGMIRHGDNTLFVVAAGNQSRDVSGDIYPAALGALQTGNVVTVAALDGSGRLASFSNFGATTVDLAAPGCRIESWLDGRQAPVALSGTSQATPLVTFTASLMYSLERRLPPAALKARLVYSGDLLPTDDHGKTAYLASLNVQKALFVFDDYLVIRGEDPAVYLGKATRISGIRCSKDAATTIRRLDDIWSIKRNDHQLWLYAGRGTGEYGNIQAPCAASAQADARMLFKPMYRVTSTEIIALEGVDEQEFALSQISEFVARARKPN